MESVQIITNIFGFNISHRKHSFWSTED